MLRLNEFEMKVVGKYGDSGVTMSDEAARQAALEAASLLKEAALLAAASGYTLKECADMVLEGLCDED